MTTIVESREHVGVKIVHVISGFLAGVGAYLAAALASHFTYQLNSDAIGIGSVAIVLALVAVGLGLFLLARRFPFSGMSAAVVILGVTLVVLLQPNPPVPLLNVGELSLPALLQLGARSYLAPLLSVALLAGAYARDRKA